MTIVICNILLCINALCLFNEANILAVYKWIMLFCVQV